MPEQDDKATGTTASEQEVGSAAAAATGTPDASAADGSASPDGKDAEFWKREAEENDRKFKQLLAQKENFERRQPAPSAPETPPNQPGSAWEQEAQKTAANLQRVMAMYEPGTVEHENAKAGFLSLQSQYATQQYLLRQQAIENAVSAIPDMHKRERVRQKLLSGQASTVEQGVALVDGEDAKSVGEERERLRRELEEARKELESVKRQRVAGGPPPLVGAGGSDPSIRWMTFADYEREVNAAEAKGDRTAVLKILHDRDAGRIRIRT